MWQIHLSPKTQKILMSVWLKMIKKTHLESMGSGFRQFVALVTYMWWNQPVTLHILISRLSIIFSGCALPLDPKNLLQFRDRVTYPTIIQWICLRENLQETMVFTTNYRGFPIDVPLNQSNEWSLVRLAEVRERESRRHQSFGNNRPMMPADFQGARIALCGKEKTHHWS